MNMFETFDANPSFFGRYAGLGGVIGDDIRGTVETGCSSRACWRPSTGRNGRKEKLSSAGKIHRTAMPYGAACFFDHTRDSLSASLFFTKQVHSFEGSAHLSPISACCEIRDGSFIVVFVIVVLCIRFPGDGKFWNPKSRPSLVLFRGVLHLSLFTVFRNSHRPKVVSRAWYTTYRWYRHLRDALVPL